MLLQPSSLSNTPATIKSSRSNYHLSLLFVGVTTIIFIVSLYVLHFLGGDGVHEDLIEKWKLKHEHLDRQIALAAASGGGSNKPQDTTILDINALEKNNEYMKSLSNVNSNEFKMAREISFRYNTRYWLESKANWQNQPDLPIQSKFISFEPWGGGFNNIRMSLEMAAAIAIALKRTLVLPPKYHMYLRGFSDFQDYFDYADMKKGISCISYLEFRNLLNLNQYDGLGTTESEVNANANAKMKTYFRGLQNIKDKKVIIHSAESWGKHIGSETVFCFPDCPSSNMNANNNNHQPPPEELKRWFDKVQYRLRAKSAKLELEPYDIVHFSENLLGHFYTFLWFEDPRLGQNVKRTIRDHVHFKEEIFAFAEEIVKELGGDFAFSCLHVRRNDFQFKEVWTPVEDIMKNTEKLFRIGEETIYIATDELSVPKKKEDELTGGWNDPTAMSKVVEHKWFKPLINAWGGKAKVKFWSDYVKKLRLDERIKKIWIGSVESVVCSRARVFVGTQKSTFSGYINRLRGYMHDVGQKRILQAQVKYPTHYYHSYVGPTWATFPHGSFGGGHPYWGQGRTDGNKKQQQQPNAVYVEYVEAWEGVYEPFH